MMAGDAANREAPTKVAIHCLAKRLVPADAARSSSGRHFRLLFRNVIWAVNLNSPNGGR
jgi:hypothetical protein